MLVLICTKPKSKCAKNYSEQPQRNMLLHSGREHKALSATKCCSRLQAISQNGRCVISCNTAQFQSLLLMSPVHPMMLTGPIRVP